MPALTSPSSYPSLPSISLLHPLLPSSLSFPPPYSSLPSSISLYFSPPPSPFTLSLSSLLSPPSL